MSKAMLENLEEFLKRRNGAERESHDLDLPRLHRAHWAKDGPLTEERDMKEYELVLEFSGPSGPFFIRKSAIDMVGSHGSGAGIQLRGSDDAVLVEESANEVAAAIWYISPDSD